VSAVCPPSYKFLLRIDGGLDRSFSFSGIAGMTSLHHFYSGNLAHCHFPVCASYPSRLGKIFPFLRVRFSFFPNFTHLLGPAPAFKMDVAPFFLYQSNKPELEPTPCARLALLAFFPYVDPLMPACLRFLYSFSGRSSSSPFLHLDRVSLRVPFSLSASGVSLFMLNLVMPSVATPVFFFFFVWPLPSGP